MRKYLAALIVGLVLLRQTPGDWVGQWQEHWALLEAAIALFVCGAIAVEIHWSCAALLAVMFCSGIYSSRWTLIGDHVYGSLFALTLVVLFFGMLMDKLLIFELAFATCTVSALWTLAGHKLGFVANESMNGCLMALTLPMALKFGALKFRATPERGAWMLLYATLVCSAVFYSGEATPIIMLTAMTAAWLIAVEKTRRYVFFALVPLAIGGLIQGHELIDPRGRLIYWQHVLSWWRASGHWLIGQGFGSGQILFPLQGISEHDAKWIFWAHNDYLQVLFEMGALGLAALLLVIAFALKKSFGREWLFSSIVGLCACMMFNSPMRHAVHGFFGVSLLWLVWNEN